MPSLRVLSSIVVVLLFPGSALNCAQQPQPRSLGSAGNPIPSAGSYYSGDPAAVVVGDTLYILADRHEAALRAKNHSSESGEK